MLIKFQEKGYGQGFYDGQMQERKYWQEANKKYIIRMTDEQYTKVIELVECDINKKWKDKIKSKIEELKDGTYDAKIILQKLLEE